MSIALSNAFDLVRLSLAFALLYVALPALALRAGRPSRPWYDDSVAAFVRVSFFFQITAMILGGWKLCLPGSLGGLYAVWLAATAAFAAKRFVVFDAIPGPRALLPLLRWADGAEPGAVKRVRGLASRIRETPLPGIFAVLVFACFLQAAWLPLHNMRFVQPESYGRALSLQSLTLGQDWNRDWTVAWLSPLVFFGGLDAATVIRWSSPIVAALLLVATGYWTWRTTGRFGAAYLASALLGLFFVAQGFEKLAEPGGAMIASLFWILALGLLNQYRGDAALAAVTAVLISRALPLPVIPAMLALMLAAGGFRWLRYMPARSRKALALAPTLSFALLAVTTPRPEPEHGAQYEEAARVAYRIAREFRQNDWILVSPGHEVPLIFGHGWHVELSDFVTRFTPAMLERAEFRLPYEAGNVFVFVEKRPLERAAFQSAQDGREASYYYDTRMGRASLEFQAARLMAAYSRSHRDASVYYEDDDLVVFRVAHR
ncbi:MAG: hypothetical protein U0Q16_26955 [Bryobacteraceae bacterium]